MNKPQEVIIHKVGHPLDGLRGTIEERKDDGTFRVQALHSSFSGYFSYNDIEMFPQIGTGATKCHPNDRYPYTIIGIEQDSHDDIKYIVVQEDDHIHLSGSFRYGYVRNPQGKVFILRQSKDGEWYDHKKTRFTLGDRDFYQAPEN